MVLWLSSAAVAAANDIDGADDTKHFHNRTVTRVVESSYDARISFPVNKGLLLPTFGSNGKEIEKLRNFIVELVAGRRFEVDSISIVSYASPEGGRRNNDMLSLERSGNVMRLVKDIYASYMDEHELVEMEIPHIECQSNSEDWQGLYTYLSEAGGKKAALANQLKKEENLIRRKSLMMNSPLYNSIKRDIFPQLRRVRLQFYMHALQTDTLRIPFAVPPLAPKSVTSSVLDNSRMNIKERYGYVPVPVLEHEPEPAEEHLPRDLRLGTNLLYDIATVANLWCEYGFNDHYAVNMLCTYSPWNIESGKKIRNLILQPEFRYYPWRRYKGHYFAFEVHMGWYNFAWGGETRYQDKDGRTPFYGAGIGYGYLLPVSQHFGFDFEIAVGYTGNIHYDCFHNVPDGALYDTVKEKGFIGPTKLGVSLYYQF